MLRNRTVDARAEAVRASLVRKSLADSRLRAGAAVMLNVRESDVLTMQHLAVTGALTPGQLATALSLTSGGVTALIQRLERLGYVSRAPHPGDRRSTVITLSEAGRGKAAELYKPLVTALDAAWDSLSDAERAAVAAFLERVADLAEVHASELLRAAATERRQVPRVPVPGLWS